VEYKASVQNFTTAEAVLLHTHRLPNFIEWANKVHPLLMPKARCLSDLLPTPQFYKKP